LELSKSISSPPTFRFRPAMVFVTALQDRIAKKRKIDTYSDTVAHCSFFQKS
jgi:hypothetical protein